MQTIILIQHENYDIPATHTIFEYSSLTEFVRLVGKIAENNDIIRDKTHSRDGLTGLFESFFPERAWRKYATIMPLDEWIQIKQTSIIMRKYINNCLTIVEGETGKAVMQ